jgi:hypothetical protein
MDSNQTCVVSQKIHMAIPNNQNGGHCVDNYEDAILQDFYHANHFFIYSHDIGLTSE